MACNSWWHIKRLSTPCSPDEHAKWSRNPLNAKFLVSITQVSPPPVNSLRPTLQGPLKTLQTHALCHSQLANNIPFPSHLKCTGNFFWHWLRPHLGRWIYTSNHFPGDSDGKESAYNAGDPGSFPGSGRSPGEKTGNPLQYSCRKIPWTENPGRLHSPRDLKELDTTEQPSLSQRGQNKQTCLKTKENSFF